MYTLGYHKHPYLKHTLGCFHFRCKIKFKDFFRYAKKDSGHSFYEIGWDKIYT